ncbi:MAG: hypothetical protein H0U69_04245 [Trueperaceae bacterium]|nr:hypothetical protein [Trueperaceae bacterium]
MRGRLFVIVVLVVAGVVIAAFNWDAMVRPVPIDLLFVAVTTTVGAIVALVAATLIGVFLLASLLDRSRHLNQISLLERYLEDAREQVDRKRAADVDALGVEVGERLDGLRAAFDGGFARLEDRLLERLGEAQVEIDDRVDALRDRVVLVRDELAADIAEVEDALLRSGRDEPREHVVEQPES